MPERTSKLCSFEEAVKLIHDGDRIGFGSFGAYQKPMAMVHEMIRAQKKDITIVGSLNSIEADMLIGAGCVNKIETSYVGLEKFGMALNFRRAAQQGRLKITHYPELISWDRFRADAEGLEFWPVSYLGGSDIVNKNPNIKTFDNPMVPGKTMYAVPSANIDIGIIHAVAGDIYGNIQIQERHLFPQSFDIAVSRATRNLIVTVEKIISTEEIIQNPHLTVIPAFRTKAVIYAPHGSHPTSVLGLYKTDDDFFGEYVKASSSDEAFHNFLAQYIYGVDSFEKYLEKVGIEQIGRLKEGGK